MNNDRLNRLHRFMIKLYEMSNEEFAAKYKIIGTAPIRIAACKYNLIAQQIEVFEYKEKLDREAKNFDPDYYVMENGKPIEKDCNKCVHLNEEQCPFKDKPPYANFPHKSTTCKFFLFDL